MVVDCGKLRAVGERPGVTVETGSDIEDSEKAAKTAKRIDDSEDSVDSEDSEDSEEIVMLQ